MSELKIMSHLGPHLNIVNLLGACTKQGEPQCERRLIITWWRGPVIVFSCINSLWCRQEAFFSEGSNGGWVRTDIIRQFRDICHTLCLFYLRTEYASNQNHHLWKGPSRKARGMSIFRGGEIHRISISGHRESRHCGGLKYKVKHRWWIR